jgi:integrase
MPTTKGLSPRQRMRILAAADKLAALQMQGNQQARRKRALLVVLLETGMPSSKILRVTMDQFDGKYFRNAKRKGRRRDDVLVSPEARASLKDYFDNERGTGPGAIFQSRNGKPMRRKEADRYLKQIGAMANVNAHADEHVHLHSHLMRPTALKHAEQKLGRANAQKKSGNVGTEDIEQYVLPCTSDYEGVMSRLYS